MRYTKTTAFIALLLAASLRGQGQRLDVPTRTDQERAEGIVSKAYDFNFARGDRDGRRKLAETLAAKAGREKNAARRFVMLQHAVRLATEAQLVRIAVDAARAIQAGFDVDRIQHTQWTLADLAETVKRHEEQIELSVEYLQLVRDALRDGRVKLARDSMKSSTKFAKRSKDSMTRRDVQEVSKQFEEIMQLHRIVVRARTRLKEEPGDAAANLEVGTYQCFVLGVWQTGLSSLQAGSDGAIAELSRADLKAPKQHEEQVTLAKEWIEISRKQRGRLPDLKRAQIERHASEWFESAIAQISGVERDYVTRLRGQLRGARSDPLLQPARMSQFVFLGSRSMKAATRDAQPTVPSAFPRQQTNDPTGPFCGRGVYFSNHGTKDIFYQISRKKRTSVVRYRGAATVKMTMAILSPNGKVLASVGPFTVGNKWSEHEIKVPKQAGREFLLRFHNEASDWFYINRIELR